MRIKVIYFVILIVFLNFTIQSKSFGFSNYLPVIKKGGEEITIKVSTLSRGNDFYIYYKTDGLKHYQVRKMKVTSQGEIYYRLPLENLYGKNLEYFIFERARGKENPLSPVFTITNFTKKESPEIYFLDAGSGGATPRKRNPLLKISPSYSSTTRLHDNSDYPGKAFSNNGNIKLYKNIYDNEYGFDFESTFNYLDEIGPDESHINLSSMIVRFKKGNHKFEAGDVSVNHTDFSTSWLSRRGLNYEMTGSKLYLNLFSLNSQQKTGFEGFGIPAPDANLFGAATGYSIGQIFKVKTIFITGKDSTDSKTMYSNDDPYREGDLISISGELKLMKSTLTLKGEYAKSNFGKGEDSNDISKEKDSAWIIGFNYYKGKLSASGDYKKIGTNYYSIANQMMLNDREGLNSMIGLNLNKVTMNVTYRDEKNYLNSATWNTERTKEIKTNMDWTIGNHFSLNANIGRNNLNYDESSGLQNSSTAMNTNSYGTSLRYYSGNNSITLGVSMIDSENFTSTFSPNLSMSFSFGKFLTLMPSASYTKTDNSDDTTSKMFNATLSSELKFIPDIFTLSIFSSYYSSESAYSDSKTFSADISLNFFMAKLFKNKITPSLSLKGSYKKSENSGITNDSTSVYLKADIAF